MQLLERSLPGNDGTVCVNLNGNEAIFKSDHATIYTRLVEGRFPRYREIVPKKTNVKIPMVAGPLLAAVRQAAIMANDDSHKVSFQFTKHKVTLRAIGADTGSSKVEVPIEYSGKPTDIAFDPRLVSDMLRVLPPDATIMLEMTDNKSPATFRCGEGFLYVAVPMV